MRIQFTITGDFLVADEELPNATPQRIEEAMKEILLKSTAKRIGAPPSAKITATVTATPAIPHE